MCLLRVQNKYYQKKFQFRNDIKHVFYNYRLFSVPTNVLKKGPLAEFEELPIALVGHKSSQGVGLTVDPRDDTIYFSPLTETAIASWQPGTNEQK